jgi:hypothetical protein
LRLYSLSEEGGGDDWVGGRCSPTSSVAAVFRIGSIVTCLSGIAVRLVLRFQLRAHR